MEAATLGHVPRGTAGRTGLDEGPPDQRRRHAGNRWSTAGTGSLDEGPPDQERRQGANSRRCTWVSQAACFARRLQPGPARPEHVMATRLIGSGSSLPGRPCYAGWRPPPPATGTGRGQSAAALPARPSPRTDPRRRHPPRLLSVTTMPAGTSRMSVPASLSALQMPGKPLSSAGRIKADSAREADTELRDLLRAANRELVLAHTLADTGYACAVSTTSATRSGRTTRGSGPAARRPDRLCPCGSGQATTPNGVLGSKLMFNVFDSLRSSLRPPAGTDAGLAFMRTAFPDAQFVWLRRADKVRQGISWWRAAVTDQWGLRPDQEAGQPAPDVEQMVALVHSPSGARMAGGSGSPQRESSPTKLSTKTSRGTGSRSRTESWSFSTSHDSTPTTFRPFATAGRPTA